MCSRTWLAECPQWGRRGCTDHSAPPVTPAQHNLTRMQDDAALETFRSLARHAAVGTKLRRWSARPFVALSRVGGCAARVPLPQPNGPDVKPRKRMDTSQMPTPHTLSRLHARVSLCHRLWDGSGHGKSGEYMWSMMQSGPKHAGLQSGRMMLAGRHTNCRCQATLCVEPRGRSCPVEDTLSRSPHGHRSPACSSAQCRALFEPGLSRRRVFSDPLPTRMPDSTSFAAPTVDQTMPFPRGGVQQSGDMPR